MKSNNHSQQNFRRDGFLGLTGRKVNLLDLYEKKLEDLEDNLRKEQNLLAGEVRGISSQYLNLIIMRHSNGTSDIYVENSVHLICLSFLWPLMQLLAHKGTAFRFSVSIIS
jgi:hypothetical protein